MLHNCILAEVVACCTEQPQTWAATCLGLSPAACMKVAPLRLCAAAASRWAARAAQPPRTRCAHRHTAQAPHSSRNRIASEEVPPASRKDADLDGCRYTNNEGPARCIAQHLEHLCDHSTLTCRKHRVFLLFSPGWGFAEDKAEI